MYVYRTYGVHGRSMYIWLPVDTVSRDHARTHAHMGAVSHVPPHASHAEPHSARTCPPEPEGVSAKPDAKPDDCEGTFKPRRAGLKRRPRIDPSPSPTPWRQRVREEQPPGRRLSVVDPTTVQKHPRPTANMALDFAATYKVLVLGDSNVGKTCIVHRYCDERYYDTYISTIGEAIHATPANTPHRPASGLPMTADDRASCIWTLLDSKMLL